MVTDVVWHSRFVFGFFPQSDFFFYPVGIRVTGELCVNLCFVVMH